VRRVDLVVFDLDGTLIDSAGDLARSVNAALLESLDALGDRALAVLTNKPGDMSRRILDGLGVAGRFARICGAGDVPAKKPDPAGLRWILEQPGFLPRPRLAPRLSPPFAG